MSIIMKDQANKEWLKSIEIKPIRDKYVSLGMTTLNVLAVVIMILLSVVLGATV